jgi:hypothetical protein
MGIINNTNLGGCFLHIQDIAVDFRSRRAKHDFQRGELQNEMLKKGKAIPGPQGWVLGERLTTSHRLETWNQASNGGA